MSRPGGYTQQPEALFYSLLLGQCPSRYGKRNAVAALKLLCLLLCKIWYLWFPPFQQYREGKWKAEEAFMIAVKSQTRVTPASSVLSESMSLSSSGEGCQRAHTLSSTGRLLLKHSLRFTLEP